jgi:hypothetical protein
VALSFETEHSDYLCDAIVDLFLVMDRLTPLLQSLAQREVKALDGTTNTELFRKHSVVSQLLSSLIQRTCETYREQILSQVVLAVGKHTREGQLFDVSSYERQKERADRFGTGGRLKQQEAVNVSVAVRQGGGEAGELRHILVLQATFVSRYIALCPC